MESEIDEAMNVLKGSVIHHQGSLDSMLRQSILSFITRTQDGSDLPPMIATFVEKVNRASHRVTDADIAVLTSAGYTEDAILEMIICAAVGAGLARAERGLAAQRDSQ